MLFQELEKYKIEYPSLTSDLTAFDEGLRILLAEIVQNKKPMFVDINPRFFSQRTRISKTHIFFMLKLLEEQGLVKSYYKVFCGRHRLLIDEYNSKSEIPSKIFCQYENKYHDKEADYEEKYYVEIVFRFTPSILTKLNTLAA